MSSPLISDPGLPGLNRLMRSGGIDDISRALAKSTYGQWSVAGLRLIRFRHRLGQRAVLQVELCLESAADKFKIPASIWIHAGGKSVKIAKRLGLSKRTVRKLPSAILEPNSGALVQLFPNDHRVPQIARFVHRPQDFAPDLFGEPVSRTLKPRLARFRPGIGATFRWQQTGGTAIFVKIFPASYKNSLAANLDQFAGQKPERCFEFPKVVGHSADISAISLAAATGRPFDEIVANASEPQIRETSRTVARALDDFHKQVSHLQNCKDHREIIKRAKRAAHIVSSASTVQGQQALQISRWIEQNARPSTLTPAHMDMKTEHLMVDGKHITILDLDSMARGDRHYDFVMLETRLADMSITDRCSPRQADAAISVISDQLNAIQSERLLWLRAVCALQVARHHAQSGHPEWSKRTATTLDQWRNRPCGIQ